MKPSTVQAKGEKLAAEGRVTEVPLARAFYVKGQSGIYLVTIVVVSPKDYPDYDYPEQKPKRAECTCRWGVSGNEGFCSHVIAATEYLRRELGNLKAKVER